MVSQVTLHRRAFWSFFAEQLPALHTRTERGNETTRWLAAGARPLILAHYQSGKSVGLFVRGARGERIGHVREFLFPHRELLGSALAHPDLRLGESFLLAESFRCDMRDRANWPSAIEWFADRSPTYERTLAALQRGSSSTASRR